MSKLRELLGHDHPVFDLNISALEKAAGNAGIDTRLLADSIEQAHDIMRKLSLNPADTTAHELYQALSSSVGRGTAEELLSSSDYVLLVVDGAPVSFNIQDVIENSHHQLDFDHRSLEHARRHLRAEVVKRYAAHERTDNSVVHKLAKEADLKPDRDKKHVKVTPKRMSRQARPSVLSAGDIFTDAFIKLNEDVARVDTDPDGSKRISLPFGSKPPYDEVEIVRAVGPAPNAAVAFSRLGLESSLDSFIGDDEVGREAIEYLNQQGVTTDDMLVEKGIKTNYYFVLRYGAERTILIKNEEFDYSWQAPAEVADWFYLALMSDQSWQYHSDLLDYLDKNPTIKLAFQPGTFHFKWGKEKLAGIYRRSYVVVMNREEAVEVTGESYDNLAKLTKGLHDLGPKVVVITDGPHGSYASFDDKLVTVPNYPDSGPPVDRTGAGDAFASTIVAALALGESMETALLWAPINSMNVVQKLGAQAGLQTKAEIIKWLERAPSDYKVTAL